MKTKIYESLRALAEKEDAKESVRQFIAERAALDTPEKRQEIAEIVYMIVREQVEQPNWVDQIFQRVDLGFQDSPVVRTKSGLDAWQLSDKADLPQRFQTTKDQLVNTYRFGGSTNASRRELGSGRIDTLQQLASEIRNQMQGKINTYVWNLLVATSSSGDANYFDTGATYKARLDSAIDYLSDFGNIRAIVGLGSAGVNAVTNFTGYSETRLSERDDSLFLQTYRGIPLVKVRQVYKSDAGDFNVEDGTAQITGDKVFVLTETAGHTIYQGGIVEDTDKNIRTGSIDLAVETYFGSVALAPGRRIAQVEYS